MGAHPLCRSLVLTSSNAVLNITAEQGSLDRIDGHVRDFVASLPAAGGSAGSFGHLLLPRKNVALTIPTQVCTRGGLVP